MEPLTEDEIAAIKANEPDEREVMEYIAAYFTKRELRLIANCTDYASDDPAGLPGHNLIMLVDKLIRYYGGPMNYLDTMEQMIGMAT